MLCIETMWEFHGVNESTIGNAFNTDEIKLVHSTIAKFPEKTSLAIVRIIDGQPQFYGAIKSNNFVEQIDNRDSIYDIGSIAKTFTSAILAQQIVDQKLSVHQDVSELLGYPFNNGASLNLLQLANHTSGLPRIPPNLFWALLFKNKANPYQHYDQGKLESYLQKQLKLKRPGQFIYSNLGVGILATALCSFTGYSYEQLLQQLICKPFGLNQVTTSREKVKNSLIQGLSTKGVVVPYWDLGAFLGAGGVYASISDLATYMLANINRASPIFVLQQQRTASIDKHMGIGLGWFIVKKQNRDKTVYFHDGGTGGFTSICLMNADEKKGVAILSNISAEHFVKRSLLPKLAQDLYLK